MSSIRVKKEHKKTVVGFNNSAAPLGERNDLHLLLNDAIGDDDLPRNEHITSMFESPLPKKSELKKLLEGDLVKKAEAVKTSAKARKAEQTIQEAEKVDETRLAPERPSDETNV